MIGPGTFSWPICSLMHPGELTESQHVLLVQGVQLQSHRVVLMFNSSKANKSHNPEVITLLVQEHSPCPVKLIWEYAKIRPRVPGQFFLWLDNSPLHYSDLASIICVLAQFLELPHQYFKLHSLRIGSATQLHLSGCTHEISSRWGISLLEPSQSTFHNFTIFSCSQK